MKLDLKRWKWWKHFRKHSFFSSFNSLMLHGNWPKCYKCRFSAEITCRLISPTLLLCICFLPRSIASKFISGAHELRKPGNFSVPSGWHLTRLPWLVSRSPSPGGVVACGETEVKKCLFGSWLHLWSFIENIPRYINIYLTTLIAAPLPNPVNRLLQPTFLTPRSSFREAKAVKRESWGPLWPRLTNG